MEEEEVIVEEETVDTLTPEVETNEPEESEEQSEEESGELDYEAILEDEKKKAEHNRKGYELRKGKNEEVSEIVAKEVDAKLSALRKEFQQDTLEAELSRLTTNESEKKLILHFYENKLVKSGLTRESIKEDLQTAYLLANAKKIQKVNKETAEAIRAKESMGNSGGSNLDKPKPTKDLSKLFSKNDWEFMKRRGWDEAKIKKAAENLQK